MVWKKRLRMKNLWLRARLVRTSNSKSSLSRLKINALKCALHMRRDDIFSLIIIIIIIIIYYTYKAQISTGLFSFPLETQINNYHKSSQMVVFHSTKHIIDLWHIVFFFTIPYLCSEHPETITWKKEKKDCFVYRLIQRTWGKLKYQISDLQTVS